MNQGYYPGPQQAQQPYGTGSIPPPPPQQQQQQPQQKPSYKTAMAAGALGGAVAGAVMTGLQQHHRQAPHGYCGPPNPQGGGPFNPGKMIGEVLNLGGRGHHGGHRGGHHH